MFPRTQNELNSPSVTRPIIIQNNYVQHVVCVCICMHMIVRMHNIVKFTMCLTLMSVYTCYIHSLAFHNLDDTVDDITSYSSCQALIWNTLDW